MAFVFLNFLLSSVKISQWIKTLKLCYTQTASYLRCVRIFLNKEVNYAINKVELINCDRISRRLTVKEFT
jgi:hypothetical protein